MARPLKKGLGYFPLDTDILSNRKIQRLTRKYGCNGLCIYLASLCELYKTHGYYIPYDDDFCFDIGFTLNIDEKQVGKVIRFCADIKLFDPGLLENQSVLTSFGIQQRFLEICKRNVVRLDPQLEIAPETGLPDPSSATGEEKRTRNHLLSDPQASAEARPGTAEGKTVRNGPATTPSVRKSAVNPTETPVYVAETLSKEKENKTETTTHYGNPIEFRSANDYGEAGRRAELLRMAADATRGK